MKNIEVNKIIDPIPASDGAGVKLKRSIGVEPNYFDPFLMLDEFGSENKDDYIAGFPPHPHRGIETVTYMLNGEFEHQDSTGAKGIMAPGDVQWMKTGRGIIHSEMPAMKGGKPLGFQLWINMPAKLKKNKPEYFYIKGNQIGRTIGYPTANIDINERDVLLRGVFCVKAIIEGDEGEYKGLANIGFKPTINGTVLTLEVHLLNFDKDIYGSNIRIDFMHRIRGEKKFNGLEELSAQINKDSKKADEFFATNQ